MKRSLPLLSAAGGLIIWSLLALAGWPPLSPPERLFLAAPLVIVPLALHLLVPGNWRSFGLYLAAVLLQPLAALLAVISLATAPGWRAGAWTAAWFLLTALVALFGVARWLSRRDWTAEIFIDVGCLFLAVGGGWLTLSRSGIHPMGFSADIVLLTAVHFHFAGFAASVFAGCLGRLLGIDPWRRLYLVAAAGVVSGIPLLAMGITLSPRLELAAAALLAVSLAALGAVAIRLAARSAAGAGARLFLAISGFSVWASMALALVYAWGEWTGRPLVNILFMARTHGALNAFGFCLCGLAAMALMPGNPRPTEKTL